MGTGIRHVENESYIVCNIGIGKRMYIADFYTKNVVFSSDISSAMRVRTLEQAKAMLVLADALKRPDESFNLKVVRTSTIVEDIDIEDVTSE